jgi:hypothetical protein
MIVSGESAGAESAAVEIIIAAIAQRITAPALSATIAQCTAPPILFMAVTV